MELTYPHTEVFDTSQKTLTFEDGFVLAIPERAFSQEVEVTIDRVTVDSSRQLQPLTGAYTFAGDPELLGELSQSARLRVPLHGELPEPTALTIFAAGPGEEYPSPDQWEPLPDGDVDVQDGSLTLVVDGLMHFYVASTAVPELSYPHTATLDSREGTLIFEDGFVLTAPEGTFTEPVEVTVDKFEVESNRGGRPVSDAYTFAGPVEPLQDLTHDVKLAIPATFDEPAPDAMTLRGTEPGEEYPSPDQWDSQPDVDIDVDDGTITASVGDVMSFYVALGAGPGGPE